MQITVHIHPAQFRTAQYTPGCAVIETVERTGWTSTSAAIFLNTPAQCDDLIKAVTAARDLLLAEITEPAGHLFVSPGLVAADRPAPDACMTCGLPRASHPCDGDELTGGSATP